MDLLSDGLTSERRKRTQAVADQFRHVHPVAMRKGELCLWASCIYRAFERRNKHADWWLVFAHWRIRHHRIQYAGCEHLGQSGSLGLLGCSRLAAALVARLGVPNLDL